MSASLSLSANPAAILTNPGQILSSVSFNVGLDVGNALAGANGRSDPQLTFLWYAQLPTIGSPAGQSILGSLTSPDSGLSTLTSSLLGSSALASAFGAGSQYTSIATGTLPWYYIETASLPFRSYDAIEIFRDGRRKKYPGHYSVDDLVLHIYGDESNVSLNYLQSWQSAVQTPFTAATPALGGMYGRASKYKFPILIYFLDINANQLTSIEYVECWPKNIGTVEMNSASDRVIYQVTFSVGDVFLNTVNVTV